MMMSDGAAGGGNTNQFIGSKISLISKSEIRYEGILYSLDLEEATISLQKVRSFGTEDRPTPRPVAPKDEVYEFIIFRGADIKGIDVLEPPPPEKPAADEEPIDPAIVEVQHYQQQGPQQPPQQPQQAQQPAPIGSLGMNDHRERFGNSFVGMGPPSGGNNMIGGAHHLGAQPGIHQGFSLGVGFGSGSGIGGAVGQSVPVQQQQARPSSPPVQNRDIPPKPLGSPPTPDREHKREQRNSTGSNGNNRRSYAPRGRGAGGGERGGMMNNSRGAGNVGMGGGAPGGAYVPRGGARPQNNYYGNRYATNGGQGPPRNYFRRGELKGNKKLTFDGEFDFEKANEELQKALMKIKIVDGEKEANEDEVHHHEEERSEDGEGSVDKENESKNFYQKDNFFDNISCEALERKQGKRERPDWRAERKLNAETFGLPLNRGGRGGGGSSTYYRGGYHSHNNYYNNYRGGYYGGRGGGYNNHRGGGGGGYRGGASRGYTRGRGGERSGLGDRASATVGSASERGSGANKD